MARVLITGGAGFLGQYLTEQLASAGHEISIIDLKPAAVSLVPLADLAKSITYNVDITKPDALTEHFADVDVVFHLAGLVSFWRKHGKALHLVNVEGTRHVLQASLTQQVGRVIHISSVAAVGFDLSNAPDSAIDESYNFPWRKAHGKDYMLSKHLAEEEVKQACDQGLNAVIVNPGLMWGPGDLTNSAKLILRMADGKVPACPPGGTNIIDVRDIALTLPRLIDNGEAGERYILGGDNITFEEVYQVIAQELRVKPPEKKLSRWLRLPLYYAALTNELLRRKPPPLTADNVDSAYRYRYFSSAKAAQELGFTRSFSFDRMIADAVAWLRQEGHLQDGESTPSTTNQEPSA